MNLVYIASAYRGDVENNILKAIEYCRYTATCGFIPICPHIYFTQFLNDDIEVERIKGISMGLQLMGYGLTGVFLVLILFYAMILLMMKIFPHRPESDEAE